MSAVSRALLLLLLAAGSIGCAWRFIPPEEGIDGLAGATRIVTLTNLHPDESYERLYAANFQQPGLIPICTDVTLVMVYTDKMRFRVNATGKEYWYLDYSATQEPLSTNLSHYFGRACPQAGLDALSDVEKEGVRLGIAKKGMGKQAVILAIGYPLRRDTPSLESGVWQYWASRLSYFKVVFDENARVERVDY